MTTTTIRLTDELKARIAAAASRTGLTAHGFILEAVAEKTALTELQADFHAQAQERQNRIERSGATVPWGEARAYLQKRADGKTATHPVPRKSARKLAR